MAGMDSAKLSARTRQPGHDRTFRRSEANFVAALREVLDGLPYRIEDHPRALAQILGGRYGVIPEASITHLPSGRVFYFEVKKQGPAGNADERACKHHTVAFYRTLAEHTGMPYHAFATVMCESLATLERYTTKHPYFFEADHYFLWKEYDLDSLSGYIDMLREKFLEAPAVPPKKVPA